MLKFTSHEVKKIVKVLVIAGVATAVLSLIFADIHKIRYIYPVLKEIYIVALLIFIVIYITGFFEKTKTLSKLLKYVTVGAVGLVLLICILFFAWYNYCFFPDDEEYLKNKLNEVVYTDNSLYNVDFDLNRNPEVLKVSSPLNKKDLDLLLNPELKRRDINIDFNPYFSDSKNNLKYATGKTFFYVYQKNSTVVKGNSYFSIDLSSSLTERFLEFDAVYPDIDFKGEGEGLVKVFFVNNGKKELLLEKVIKKEIKPNIEAFRFSNFINAMWFYLKNPGRSVITEKTGWEKIRTDIPQAAGELVVEFNSPAAGSNYLFAGTPRIYSVKKGERNEHFNLVYIIFDTLGQQHVDYYEYYNKFIEKGYDGAIKSIGSSNIITPSMDRYYNRSIIFDNIITAGQVTRPSITSLWSSQIYTKLRMPVFRNIVSMENQKEFYDKGFTTLGEELSKEGYITKQIACNAQGHNVSGVGVDLGFDENHDYTMEASEYTANIQHIVEFLEENQNRKFFLYTHLNVPHTPKWIPAKYFLRELWDSDFNIDTAKIRGNIKYADFNFSIIMDTIKKLKLDKNTYVVVTADHSSGEPLGFRDRPGRQLAAVIKNGRQSQRVADFHNNAVYVRKGTQHLYSDYMQIPFILLPPIDSNMAFGRNSSYISTLDIAPTFLDIFTGKKENRFSGKSFKYILNNPVMDRKVHSSFIPLVGRFMRGFIYEGKYKYWWNVKGIYKYRIGEKGLKYIQHPEHLFDLSHDPYETNNLVNNKNYKKILQNMRKLRLDKYRDYDEKNYIQIMPDEKADGNIEIKVKALTGAIIYPKKYGSNISFKQKGANDLEIVALKSREYRVISFETKPNRSPLKFSVYRGGKLLKNRDVYVGVERTSVLGNPFFINSQKDFFISLVHGKTGLEANNLPENSVYYYRIPLNYWLEMSREVSDVNLSPGIKEVLRGWGYIQ